MSSFFNLKEKELAEFAPREVALMVFLNFAKFANSPIDIKKTRIPINTIFFYFLFFCLHGEVANLAEFFFYFL